jgi:hypothetical protein
MIKFFRKIRQRLLTENKISKYLLYAIGEIILVVIGILIALQVNEWNYERNRKIAEQEIITQLQIDLEESRNELDEIKNLHLRGARFSAQMTRAFFKEELPENIRDYMYGALGSRVYSPVLGTARSLINSGKLDILSEAELKNDIISYIEKVDYMLKDISRYEETYFRKGVDLVRAVQPTTIQSIEELNNMKPENIRGFEINVNEFEGPVEKIPFQSDIKDLFEDERFYTAYSYLLLSHRNIYYRYDNILDITNDLLDKLSQATTKSDLTVNNVGHHLILDSLDLKIIMKADSLLSDSTKWNKNGDWECSDDVATDTYSLFCALRAASKSILEEPDDNRHTYKIVGYILMKYENRRVINNKYIDWNNHPDTTFEELKKVLQESMEEVKKQL